MHPQIISSLGKQLQVGILDLIFTLQTTTLSLFLLFIFVECIMTLIHTILLEHEDKF